MLNYNQRSSVIIHFPVHDTKCAVDLVLECKISVGLQGLVFFSNSPCTQIDDFCSLSKGSIILCVVGAADAMFGLAISPENKNIRFINSYYYKT